MDRRRDIVMIDPTHDYAVWFVDAAWRRGLGTVCLWTGAGSRSQAWAFPRLRSAAVSAHYTVGLDEPGLRRAAALLAERHDVAGVVPFSEPVVAPSAALADLLGLSWAQPEVLPLFRDKRALKLAVQQRPDGPRINRTALVADVHDVRAEMAEQGLDRVVLKPNDGYGNSSIGFFDRSTPDADIAAHLHEHGRTMLLEERLEGVEYFVNGQVDAAGHVDVVRVGVYVRAAINGRPNVEVAHRAVRTHEPEFQVLADYARQVVEATGVRRTPFHLECILDDEGPCLVEVAARLAGGDPTFDSWLHGTDLVDAALVQYVDDGTTDPLPLDWDRYDAQVASHVRGTCDRHGRILRVRGVERATDLPGFVKWGRPPAVGDIVVPTVDVGGTVWDAVVVGPDLDTWEQRVATLRATVEVDVLEPGEGGRVDRARVLAPAVGRLLRRGWAWGVVRRRPGRRRTGPTTGPPTGPTTGSATGG